MVWRDLFVQNTLPNGRVFCCVGYENQQRQVTLAKNKDGHEHAHNKQHTYDRDDNFECR